MKTIKNTEAFDKYIQNIQNRNEIELEFLPSLGCYLFIRKRMSGALAKIHEYYFIKEEELADKNIIKQYTDDCITYTIQNYKGFARGMQKGLSIYPVVCQKKVNPEAIAWIKKKPKARFATFVFPVIMNLTTKDLHYMEKTPIWGFAMWHGVKKSAKKTLES